MYTRTGRVCVCEREKEREKSEREALNRRHT